MINLPKSTEFNKRIPKQKFYEKLNVTPTLKRSFIDQIKTVIWRNKIAESTLNISPGKTVTEIEIFEIQLNSSELDTDVLKLIEYIKTVVREKKNIDLCCEVKFIGRQ